LLCKIQNKEGEIMFEHILNLLRAWYIMLLNWLPVMPPV